MGSENEEMSAPASPVLLAAGLATLDVVYEGEGEGSASVAAGGTAANVAAIATSLGLPSYMLARLGLDAAAGMALEDLGRCGVRLDFSCLSPSAATPIIVQRRWRDASGAARHSFSLRCPRCRRYLPGFSPVRLDTAGAIRDTLPLPTIFFFDRDARGILFLAKWARDSGALVVFEPSSTGDSGSRFREALGLAHILKYSRERLPGLAEREDLSRAPLLEIETLAEKGLRYRSRLPDPPASGWRHLSPVQASVIVDTAGAGDWCTAGLLRLAAGDGLAGFQTLTGDRIEMALRYGQTLAAWNCQFIGARGGMYGKAAPSLMAAFIERRIGPGYPAPPPIESAPSAQQASLGELMCILCPMCRGSREGATALASGEVESSPGPWRTVERPGYVGKRARQASAECDNRFGPGRWRIAYAWDGGVIDRTEALGLYTDAYRVYLERHPDVLEWLVGTASDVYDIEPRDLESGTDFSIQKAAATHLQDIAVRIAVKQLGRCFKGRDLIQIRGRDSLGHRLNPGQVLFHMPEKIVMPEIKGWWSPGSIESFWQSNKILQVRRRKILMFGGSFNPVHSGHLAFARHARDTLGFDRVLFIPNGDNYGKYRQHDLAPGVARIELLAAAIAGEAGFEVVGVEVTSAKRMRTVVTTEEIRAANPDDDLVLLRGLDALPRTHPKLFGISGLRVLVIDRANATSFEDVLARHPHLRDNRARIDYQRGDFAFDLSASQVRAAVAAGRPIAEMVPTPVADLIQKHGLYRTQAIGDRPAGNPVPPDARPDPGDDRQPDPFPRT